MSTAKTSLKGRADVADRIHSAAIKLIRRARKTDLALTGMSTARLSALSILVFGTGPRTLGELADADGVRPPTMTGIIRGLEEDGYVERRPDRDDRRVTRVRATRKGKALVQGARVARVKAILSTLGSLSAKEMEQVGKVAELIERALREKH